MTSELTAQTPSPMLAVPETTRRELAIEVEGLSKSYRIPTLKLDTLKERAVRPFERQQYRLLRALEQIGFDVRRGEFFGIVGRNGSGKSTLLKLLASIYRADAGSDPDRRPARLPSSSSGSASTPSSPPTRTSSSTA